MRGIVKGVERIGAGVGNGWRRIEEVVGGRGGDR